MGPGAAAPVIASRNHSHTCRKDPYRKLRAGPSLARLLPALWERGPIMPEHSPQGNSRGRLTTPQCTLERMAEIVSGLIPIFSNRSNSSSMLRIRIVFSNGQRAEISSSAIRLMSCEIGAGLLPSLSE